MWIRHSSGRSGRVASNAAVETGIETGADTDLEGMLMKFQVRRVSRHAAGMIASAIVVMVAGSAGATPMMIAQSAFSGSQTIIDFNDLVPGTPIVSQYDALGVTFSGGLYASGVFTSPPGGAQNFLPTTVPTPITIDFSSTMLRVGFDVITNPVDNLFVTAKAYSGDTLVSTGQLEFTTGGTAVFAGIEDSMTGIDRLVLEGFRDGGAGVPCDPNGQPPGCGPAGSGGFIIDNFQFEAAGAVVPEPSAGLLFPTGLLILAACTRRRRRGIS